MEHNMGITHAEAREGERRHTHLRPACRPHACGGVRGVAAAVVVQSIHWMMKPIQPMPWRNYDANYVSRYFVYNIACDGSTEMIDG